MARVNVEILEENLFARMYLRQFHTLEGEPGHYGASAALNRRVLPQRTEDLPPITSRNNVYLYNRIVSIFYHVYIKANINGFCNSLFFIDLIDENTIVSKRTS